MKKTIFFIAAVLFMSQAVTAKKLLTEGYDKYNNSFKLDLVSVGYMSNSRGCLIKPHAVFFNTKSLECFLRITIAREIYKSLLT